MKTSLRLLLIIVSLLLNKAGYNQKSITFFADTLQKGNTGKVIAFTTKGQFIYFGGQSFDSTVGYYYTPSISKIDTTGATLWTFAPNKQMDDERPILGGSLYPNAYIDQLILDGEFIYATCFVPETNKREIWKIHEPTGSFIWKTAFDVRLEGEVTLRVADGEHLAFGYDGTIPMYKYMYAVVGKKDGQIKTSKVLIDGIDVTSRLNFEIDTDGSLYLSKADTLFKYNNIYGDKITWYRKINGNIISQIKLTSNNELYAFGKSGSMHATKLNKSDGNVIWNNITVLLPRYLSDRISDIKFTNTSIYISGMIDGYGSVYSGYHIWKMNRTTGVTQWDKAYNKEWINDTIPISFLDYTSILSFDVDAQENLYATGYQGAGDRERAIWGICKFDGATGKIIYQTPVYEGAPFRSSFSRGVHAYVYNNRVFYIGEFQKPEPVTTLFVGSAYANTFLLATDTTSQFNTYRKKEIKSQFQYYSQVSDIKQFSKNKYAVYKQVGKSGVVELRRSSDGSLLWSKTITRLAHLTADRMVVTADHKIAITALGHLGTSMQYDYIKMPDTLFFMKLDSTGVLKEEKKYFTGELKNFIPVQLFATPDTNTVLAYNQLDHNGIPYSLHLFNFDKSITPFGGYLNYHAIHYSPASFRQQLLLPITKDTAIVVYKRPANVEGTNTIFEKLTFKQVSGNGIHSGGLKSPPFDMRLIYNLAPCDSSTILMMGRNNAGLALLARYNHRTASVVWAKSELSAYTIAAASSASKFIYWMGVKSDDLIIRQLNTADGSQNWEYTLTGNDQRAYIPQNQTYNEQRGEYTVSGYTVDSTNLSNFRSAFYITVDSTGKLIKLWKEEADFHYQNGLKALEISQYGQTLIGGALYKVPHGKSGVIIEADSALVQQVITGIQPVNTTEFKVSIHPNPAIGSSIQLSIETKKPLSNLDIQLFSANGILVQTQILRNHPRGIVHTTLKGIKSKGTFYIIVRDKNEVYTVPVIVL